MGFWNISVRGVGAHHNKDYPKDADQMAKKFVAELKAAGHQIISADITFGGQDDIAGSKAEDPPLPAPPDSPPTP